MDSEQQTMTVQERLAMFRLTAKNARSPAELVERLDRPMLVHAGWTVHTDNSRFIGATRLTKDGDELELSCSRVNGTLAGLRTIRRRPPPKRTFFGTFQLAMDGRLTDRELSIRHHFPDELNWSEVAQLI